MIPVVAIVGRPNVGKSTLFNRIVGRRRSIVADEPGVTRDRIYVETMLRGVGRDREIVLVDTGGFEPKNPDKIMQRVLDQTQLALDEADVVVFVTDGRAGVLPEDDDIARVLRRGGKSVIVAVNKIDGPKHDDLVYEFHSMGLEPVIPISAEHGVYTVDLQEMIHERLPPAPPPVEESDAEGDGPIRISVIGRPNVGKSSLINRLLGEDRHLVSDVAGTTRDTVDSLIERNGRRFLFIDTAGIRRKRSIALRVEKFSVVIALKGIARSDVALLLLDATETVADQDAKVAAFAYERGKAVMLVVSKWDARQGEARKREHTAMIRQELPHLSYAPIVYTSAVSGEGLGKLFPEIQRVDEEYGRRVTTGELNRFVEELMKHHPPPSRKGRHARLYYMTQIGVRPPRFLVSVNDPKLVHFSYRRYLINELRKRYGFDGVPLLLGYRGHKQKKDG